MNDMNIDSFLATFVFSEILHDFKLDFDERPILDRFEIRRLYIRGFDVIKVEKYILTLIFRCEFLLLHIQL